MRQLGMLAGALFVLALIAALLEPYRRERLTSFLDPWSDAEGSGFQSVQAMIAIGSGGLFGVGLGQSVQKLFYLPEAHTDMILAVIGEELGFAGIGVVLFLYGMIAYAGPARRSHGEDLYSKLLAAGITSVILIQATVNFFAVLGVLPLTGVPLPFISYGNSNLVVLLAGMGILINVAQRAAGRARKPRLRVVEGTGHDRPARSIRQRMPRVVIAAGGTAGHVVPALAVADELRARGAEQLLAGTRGRAEGELVPGAGYEIAYFSVSGIDRRNPLRARARSRSRRGRAGGARGLLGGCGADAVLGGGGYVAGPVGLAAGARRTPLVLTEADSRLGLANRLLAPFARRVCLAFPIEGRDGDRYVVTGRPVPRAVVTADRDAARARLGIDARSAVRARVRRQPRGPEPQPRRGRGVRATRAPACCTSPAAATSPSVQARGSAKRRPHYRLFEYLDTLADPLAASDLVLARAGGSIFEIAAAGRPAVLVPYPHATADHQAATPTGWRTRARRS